ncbi:hypothetical protein ACJJTC_010463 [Scirpophaga incertulas]
MTATSSFSVENLIRISKSERWQKCMPTKIISAKIFFLISIISFLMSTIWFSAVKRDERDVLQAIEDVGNDIKYINVYRKPNKLPKGFKYVLLWTPNSYSPFYFFGKGQKAFIKNKCATIKCYITTDRFLFGGMDSVSKFDAIAFNGRNIDTIRRVNLPRQRLMRQKYIYFNLESPQNYPVCSAIFDNFFNLTSTYKLDSDIQYSYILIRNKDGDVVGPKKNMKWVTDDITDSHDKIAHNFTTKTKAVAWFVSNCSDKSGRKNYVWYLQKALAAFNLTVDIYGKCGYFDCPVDRKAECNSMLERDYYFYLAMENSIADDYITEKVLTALQNNIVPIVYGGANYSQFLPPGSYLDARALDAFTLAHYIEKLIRYPESYNRFFMWKRHYTFHDPTAKENVCSLCAALHNESLMSSVSVYKNFREWWHPKYKDSCSLKDEDNEKEIHL